MKPLFTLNLSPNNYFWLVILIILVFYYLGCSSKRFLLKKKILTESTNSTTNTTLLALFGLLLAFSFNLANSRFDDRRKLIVDEANAISTAYSRIHLLPEKTKIKANILFEKYINERINYFAVGSNPSKIEKSFKKSAAISQSIIDVVINNKEKVNESIYVVSIIESLNTMADICASRNVSIKAKIPELILSLLLFLCCIAGLLLGLECGSIYDRIIALIFAVSVAFTIGTIVDLDSSRSGEINLSKVNQEIIDLKKIIKP